MGHPDLAMLLYIEALAAMRRTLGDEDPGALINLITNRASLYKETNQYALALPLCEEAVARRRRVLGNANVDTLISITCPIYTMTWVDMIRLYRCATRSSPRAGGSWATPTHRRSTPSTTWLSYTRIWASTWQRRRWCESRRA